MLIYSKMIELRLVFICFTWQCLICAIHRNADLLPDKSVCGIQSQERIYGGEEAEIGEFPWLALLFFNEGGKKDFMCGGALISNRYVLTAAHCADNTLLSVRLGEHNVKTEEDCDDSEPGLQYCAEPFLELGFERKIVHEKHNSTSGENDIALLRLDRTVNYTGKPSAPSDKVKNCFWRKTRTLPKLKSLHNCLFLILVNLPQPGLASCPNPSFVLLNYFIKPICLPFSSDLKNKTYAGETAMVAGWGKTKTYHESSIKLKVEVPVVANEVCVKNYQKYHIHVTKRHLCAGGIRGINACTGDSGGPLMYLHRSDNHENWVGIGVVSFGLSKCALKNVPVVYTRTTKYMKWILNNIEP